MGTKLRVCYVLNTFDLGGAETVALDLARSHDPRRFEVEIVGAMDPKRDQEPVMQVRCREAGVKAVSLGQPNLRSLGAVLRFYQFLLQGRFDIVMGHNRGSDYWAVKLGRLAGIRHRYLARHLVYPDVDERHRKRYRGIAGSMHKVVAVSEAVRRSCIEEEGLPESLVETVVNGIDTAVFKPLEEAERDRIRGELGHPEDHHLLLFVGRFADQKAPRSFVALINRLVAAGQKVKGYMCGHGPLDADVRQLAGESEGRVSVLGLRSDIPALLGSCDLFVSTSRYEGLPLNVMEAMASGAPFAGPAIPQILELCDDHPDLQQSIFEAPPKEGPVPDHLVESWAGHVSGLLGDRIALVRSGESGRLVIQDQFSLQKMVSRYESIYLEDCL